MPPQPAQPPPEEENRLWKAAKMAALVVGSQIVIKQLTKGVSRLGRTCLQCTHYVLDSSHLKHLFDLYR